jgi:hypothetical protein
LLQGMGSGYRDWAQAKIDNIKGILEASRSEHTQAVKERIQSVEKMKDVVSVTEGLFALSKETAQLEADAFVQRQKVALATEVKAVLDSWVRFEQQQKEEEQANLTKSVIENVLKSIKDEKTQKDILLGAIAEVEREPISSCQHRSLLTSIFLFPSFCAALDAVGYFRTCQEQGRIILCLSHTLEQYTCVGIHYNLGDWLEHVQHERDDVPGWRWPG